MLYIKKIGVFVLFLFLLVGCAKDDTSLAYDDYQKIFFDFVASFEPIDFIDISNEDYVSVTSSLPENTLNSNKIDALDDNIKQPLRYETYYLSSDKSILVHVNFIYSPENKDMKILSLYSTNNNNNSNISAEYQSIIRPTIINYLVSMNGYIVNLEFVDVSQRYVDEKYSDFALKCSSFYTQIEQCLLEIKN